MLHLDEAPERLNWWVVLLLLAVVIVLFVAAAKRDDGYRRSVELEVAAGLLLFLSIQALLGREVDDHEHAKVFVFGLLGVAIVAIAHWRTKFTQAVMIELGMGAVLFCVLDVLVVQRLRRRIEHLETGIPGWLDLVDEERKEELERQLGKWIFGEDWEPGDPIGHPGGMSDEEYRQRFMEDYESEILGKNSETPPRP